LMHVKRLKKQGQKADCDKETVSAAKAAYKRYRRKPAAGAGAGAAGGDADKAP